MKDPNRTKNKMAASSKAEYLKKYLSGSTEENKQKKKKKKGQLVAKLPRYL